MKKRSFAIVFTVLITMLTTRIFAGSIDYLSNQSAEYIRTFSRNASTDTDAVNYNPAGTAFMEDGISLYLSNQSILKYYSNTSKDTGTEFKTEKPSLLVPNAYVVFKKTQFAGFLGTGIIGGGGEVEYKDGLPSMEHPVFAGGKITSSSYYFGVTAGGAYAINDMFSISLAARYIDAQKKYKGEADYGVLTRYLDAENNATGYGGIIGLDIKFLENLLFAIRYETATKLDFETNVKQDDFSIFTDGAKTRHDLPAMLALGISIMPIEKLTLTTSLDVFLIKLSDQDKDSEGEDGYSDDYDPYGYEASLSAEYEVSEGLLAVSAGYMYDKVGGNKNTYNDFDFSLDSHSLGLGAKITPVENLALTVAAAKITYIDGTGTVNNTVPTAIEVKYKKSAWTVALGAEYRL